MPNFEDLPEEEKTKMVQSYILTSWNLTQDLKFKSGGIAMPKFESYVDLLKFQKEIEKNPFFKPATIKFSDIKEADIGTRVTFDLPPKFKIENENA